jgi:hypothetical protein
MTEPSPDPGSDPLLVQLRVALERADRPVREIEVGIPLSIALGRLRPATSCGGCSVPLQFQGVPARTVVELREPFRLLLSDGPDPA